MITVHAQSRKAWGLTSALVTSGSAGIPCEIDLSSDFEGLASVVCFRAGSVAVDMPYEPTMTVPHEVLAKAGETLQIGVYASDADGNVIIPTIWASIATIRQGVVPSEVDPSQPTPSWAAQVQQWAEDARDTAERLGQEVDGWESEIDAAVRGAEAVDATASKSGTTATITVTDRTGTEHIVTVSDGERGPQGERGPSGDSFAFEVSGGHLYCITSEETETRFSISDKHLIMEVI